ncbi:NUDIX hydrolase [Clostridium butyricum]|uniref:NUDIX hydrolase n=1 Tax=Clostridium butyricum TaxID=1492 RepID=UPI003D0E719D
MKKEVYNNGYYRVCDENNIISIESLKGGVVIIPITKNKKIILIKEFRLNINEISIEFPRGFVENEESSLEGAKRELFEEIGGVAEEFEVLGSIATNNGISNEKVDYYVAWDTTFSYEELQSEENIIDVVEYSLTELMNLIKESKITDSFTLCGTLKFLLSMKI